MYYGSGNYEAFAHAKKPEGMEQKSTIIIGGGLAGLAAAEKWNSPFRNGYGSRWSG